MPSNKSSAYFTVATYICACEGAKKGFRRKEVRDKKEEMETADEEQ